MAEAGSVKLRRLVLVAAIAALGVAAGVLAVNYTGRGSDESDVNQVFEQVRRTPLVRLVLQENPALEARVRQTIEEERLHPTNSGPNRLFQFGAEVRRQYIIPALRDCDDAAALDAIMVMSELVRHLRAADAETCRQLGQSGIQRPDKLDADGAEIFRRALAAQEGAYLNGKSAVKSRSQPDSTEFRAVLADAGYTPADFQQLANYPKLAANEACAAMDKLYAAPTSLPPERGAIVARYLLTVSQ